MLPGWESLGFFLRIPSFISSIIPLPLQLQALLKECSEYIFVTHIRSLSGPSLLMSQGNEITGCLAVTVFTSPVQEHQATHKQQLPSCTFSHLMETIQTIFPC